MRIIALVIGNNNYSDPNKLENAVNDAKSMEDVICIEKKKQILLIKSVTLKIYQGDVFLFSAINYVLIYYLSMRMRASTATTALAEPRRGLRSISAISGATVTSAEIRETASAKRSSLTGS